MNIIINGKSYEVYIDSFGITYIDGMLRDEWLETLDQASINFLATKGQKVVKEEPERFNDIAERLEMPKDLADKMRNMA